MGDGVNKVANGSITTPRHKHHATDMLVIA
jgi:hypothetical protein